MIDEEELLSLEDTANKRLASILGYLNNFSIDSAKENVDPVHKLSSHFVNREKDEEPGARSPSIDDRLANLIGVHNGDSSDSKESSIILSKSWFWDDFESHKRQNLINAENDEIGALMRKNAGNNIQTKIFEMRRVLDKLIEVSLSFCLVHEYLDSQL